MSKYKLVLAYDGTHFQGWQIQPNATSIQAVVEKALQIALKKFVKLVGSGRTDSGVHALAQVAHFIWEGTIELKKLFISLNGLLPMDIRVLSVEIVPDDFHARFSATRKIYHYRIDLSRTPLPFSRLYSYHLPYSIDFLLLKRSAKLFIGKKDFTSFSNEAHRGSAARNSIRTITRLDIIQKENELILEFEGDGFLYKMVRNIVGTLLDVARGKIPIKKIPYIFEEKNRSFAGATAPAHGLFLVEVIYPSNF